MVSNARSEEAARYFKWREDEEAAGERIASYLCNMESVPSFEDIRTSYPEAIRIGVARKLAEKAHAMLAHAPPRALSVAILATDVAAHAPCPPEFSFAAFDAEGFTWMRRAAALLKLGKFHEALAAAKEADWLLFLAAPYALRSAATLGLIQGQIRHALGDTDQGLRLIRLSADIILEVFDETAKYVEAMTVYGGILMRADRFDEAAQTWEDIASLARENGDTATLAYILNNVGLCYLHIRRLDLAKQCFTTALKMFTELNYFTEVPRVRGGFAMALIQEGRYAQAIWEYHQIRADFLKFEMFVDAALASVRIIETSFVAGRVRDIARLCEETLQFFTSAGLPQEARKAAAYMYDAARKGDLSIDDVRDVEVFLERLQLMPDEKFLLDELEN